MASVVSDDAVDLAAAAFLPEAAFRALLVREISVCNSPRRISSISAARYKIWPRRWGLCFDQFGNAVRAAKTASRKSFRDARAKLATIFPFMPRAGRTRPCSLRTNL